MKLFRWKAIIPLGLLALLTAAVLLLCMDGLVRRGIEMAGAQITGARVDLASARVRPFAGSVRLRGLEVADPQAYMHNLVEAAEIVAEVRFWPLFQKKIVVDTLAVRGMRFGTPRSVSGELPRRRKTTGLPAREVTRSFEGIRLPPFSLRGIGETVVEGGAIEPDSLITVQQARALAGLADSLREAWSVEVRALDPAPVIASAHELSQRISTLNLRTVAGLAAARGILTEGVDLLTDLRNKQDRLTSLDERLKADQQELQQRLRTLDRARDQDRQWALGQLNIPSLEAPDIGPALFGEMVIDHLGRVLQWIELADRHMPPGLDPRRRPGPSRTRRPGITVHFPEREALPSWVIAWADISFEWPHHDRPRTYSARLAGLTSEPTVWGRPLVLEVSESGERLSALSIHALIDRLGETARDSVRVEVTGIGISPFSLGELGGHLNLGRSDSHIHLLRQDGRIDARLGWRSSDVRWERTRPAADPAPRIGSTEWAEDFIWRTLEGLDRVEIEARLVRQGEQASPRLQVHSNVAQALSISLQRQLGQQVRRAEQQVRQEVDRHIEAQVAEARQQIEGMQEQVLERLEQERERLEAAREQLEQQLRALAARIPGAAVVIPPGR